MIMHFMSILWMKAHFYIDFTTSHPVLLRSKYKVCAGGKNIKAILVGKWATTIIKEILKSETEFFFSLPPPIKVAMK